MHSMDGHNGGIFYYPAALLPGFFPWSIFWLPAVFDAGRGQRAGGARGAAEVFVLCWVGVYVGLFSLAKTKLPSYITPCYPGLALLSGAFIERWTTGKLELAPLWRRLSFGSLIVAGLAITIFLPIVSHRFLPGEEWLGLVGTIPLVGGIGSLWLAERNRLLSACRLTTVTAVLFVTTCFAFVAARVDRHRHLEDFVAAVYGEEAVSDVRVASLSTTEASWVFYCRQPIPQLNDPLDAVRFLSQTESASRRPVLVTSDKRLQKYAGQFPLEDYQQRRIPYFLENDQIVVLQPRPALTAATPDAENR
jgi:4-amino-4-deoxy-L-arabinose transferase-like glycosyltransferase